MHFYTILHKRKLKIDPENQEEMKVCRQREMTRGKEIIKGKEGKR